MRCVELFSRKWVQSVAPSAYSLQNRRGQIFVRSCVLLSINTTIEPPSRVRKSTIPLIQSFNDMALLQNGFEFTSTSFLELGIQLPPDAFQSRRTVSRWGWKTCAEVFVGVGFQSRSKGSRENLLERTCTYAWCGWDRSLWRR